jgi:hypothetical protein
MRLSLTTWERVQLTKILGQMRGNLATLRKAGRAMDAVELSQKEKTEVGFNTIVNPKDGGVQFQWADAEREFDVEIADREAAALLRRAFQQYEGWQVAERMLVEVLAAKIEASGQSEK